MANEGGNITNHIDKLPPEILGYIFVLGSLHSSSSVSRRWNSLALAETRLWSKIFIAIEWQFEDWKEVGNGGTRRADEAEISGASLWLARSKNAPLDVCIWVWNAPGWIHDRVKEIVFPHLHRCRYLELQLPPTIPSFWIDYSKIWFPLPGMPDLDDLYIRVEFDPDDFRRAVDIGALPPLRKFKFKSNSCPVLLLNIRVTEELELEGCDGETVVNILAHCTGVKWIRMPIPHGLPFPCSVPLSFPSLRRLDVFRANQFPIQAAPNLRQLRFLGAGFGFEFGVQSRDVISILTGLEVLSIPENHFLAVLTIGSLVRSERLKVLRITSCTLPGEVVQSLISPVLPLSSQSHFVAEQQSAQHMAFPELKVLLIVGAYARWSERVFGLAQDLLEARSSLTVACDFGVDSSSPRFEEIANVVPKEFILAPSSEVFDRSVKDLGIE